MKQYRLLYKMIGGAYGADPSDEISVILETFDKFPLETKIYYYIFSGQTHPRIDTLVGTGVSEERGKFSEKLSIYSIPEEALSKLTPLGTFSDKIINNITHSSELFIRSIDSENRPYTTINQLKIDMQLDVLNTSPGTHNWYPTDKINLKENIGEILSDWTELKQPSITGTFSSGNRGTQNCGIYIKGRKLLKCGWRGTIDEDMIRKIGTSPLPFIYKTYKSQDGKFYTEIERIDYDLLDYFAVHLSNVIFDRMTGKSKVLDALKCLYKTTCKVITYNKNDVIQKFKELEPGDIPFLNVYREFTKRLIELFDRQLLNISKKLYIREKELFYQGVKGNDYKPENFAVNTKNDGTGDITDRGIVYIDCDLDFITGTMIGSRPDSEIVSSHIIEEWEGNRELNIQLQSNEAKIKIDNKSIRKEIFERFITYYKSLIWDIEFIKIDGDTSGIDQRILDIFKAPFKELGNSVLLSVIDITPLIDEINSISDLYSNKFDYIERKVYDIIFKHSTMKHMVSYLKLLS